MKQTSWIRLSSLLIVATVFSLSATCFGQGTQSTTAGQSSGKTADSETAKQLEIALIKLGASEAREELQKQRLAEKDATIKALEDARDVRVGQIADLRTANKERATVNTGDARMLEQANMVIAKQDAEISKLRNPGLFASIFDMRTAYGGMVGYAACRLTSGSNPTISIPGLNSQFVMSSEERARQALRLSR